MTVYSGAWGPDAVESILSHRGHSIAGVGEARDILLPLDRQPTLSGEEFNRFYELFGKRSFRQIAGRLLRAGRIPVPVSDLEQNAGGDTYRYLEFLESLDVGALAGDAFTVTRPVNNIGPTLEWYVAELCRRELSGSAAWGVKLEGLSAGGDYDVLAWLPPTLVYVETKSASPDHVTESELRHFLQRADELAPEVALLLVDTSTRMDDLVARLFELMLPPMRESSGVGDPTWRPDRPFVRPVPEYPGISYGYRRIYLSNSEPSIRTQMQRAVRHYHAVVKGASFWGGRPINWITGQVGDE
jgi:hypothetical protein